MQERGKKWEATSFGVWVDLDGKVEGIQVEYAKAKDKKPGVGKKCARIFVVEGGCVHSLFDEVPPFCLMCI